MLQEGGGTGWHTQRKREAVEEGERGEMGGAAARRGTASEEAVVNAPGGSRRVGDTRGMETVFAWRQTHRQPQGSGYPPYGMTMCTRPLSPCTCGLGCRACGLRRRRTFLSCAS